MPVPEAASSSSSIEDLARLPSCTLVTTGRTGTDFLQSLLDSHPQVLTFNGYLLFHSFWRSSVCVAAGEFAASDLIDEFIGKHIQIFKSRYDLIERKHELGEDQDQSLDIDLDQFKDECLRLLEGYQLTTKNVLLAVYGAYAFCLGQDLGQKQLFFHHVHAFEELGPYLEDFPDSKIISMTRDPRANFVSGIENHRNFNKFRDTDNGVHLYFYIKRILQDAAPLEKYGNEYRAVRIEDLDGHEFLEVLCAWLDIPYNDCMTRSTWAGMAWHGDAVSNAGKIDGSSRAILRNRWESRLSRFDKFVFNYIMYFRLKHYGYNFRRITPLDTLLVALLIPLPLSYEFRYFSPGYIARSVRNREFRKLASNVLAYGKRVVLFYKHYLGVTRRQKFNQPLLKIE